VHLLALATFLQELKRIETIAIILALQPSFYFTLVFVSTAALHLMLSTFTVEISSVTFLAMQIGIGIQIKKFAMKPATFLYITLTKISHTCGAFLLKLF